MKLGFAILDRDVGHPLGSFSTPRKRPVALAQSTLNVLAPIDLSHDPAGPVDAAFGMARALGAHLTLLNVTDTGKPLFDWPSKVIDGSLTGTVDYWSVPGRVPETVARFGDLVAADLLLISPRSFGKWMPFRSVTTEVMALSDRPVMVGAGHPFNCRTILCALTLTGNDDATVRHAEALARRSGGELILFSAVPDPSEGMLHDVLSGSPLSLDVAHRRMRRTGRSLSVPYKSLTLSGSIEECIGRVAKEHSADVVIANRNELDPRPVFRRLHCPLLSVAGSRTSGRTVRDILAEELHATAAT